MAAKDGVVALIVAFSALPLLLLTGAAVDMHRISSARTNLQAVADAAALAGANALRQSGDAAQATQTARNHVMGALEGAGVRQTGDPTVTVSGASVNVKVSASVEMTLMKIIRMNNVAITSDATAAYGAARDEVVETAEIVLALDTTGSMGLEGRMDAAKTAAKSLITKVMNKNGAPDPAVSVGLVPFAQYVNVGLQYRNESWMTDTQDSSVPGRQSCGTAYRTWDLGPLQRIAKTCWSSNETYTDCSYDKQTYVNPRDPYQLCSELPAETHKWNGCVGSDPSTWWDSNYGQPRTYYLDEQVEIFGRFSQVNQVRGILDIECAKPLVRLTSSQGELNSSIDALTPNGFTYIAPAVLWSWRLLTRGQPFTDARSVGNAVKSMVLMTDGANTRAARPGYYEHSVGDVQSAEAVTMANDKTLAVCANAKAAGIKIYTIGFMAPAEVKPILRACASSTTNYYDAPSVPELQRAFNDIGARMTALRLVK